MPPKRLSAPPPVAIASRDGVRPGWAQLLARNWRYGQLAKIAGICAFTALFFVGYFHLLRNPSSTPLVMPLTALDNWIPYQPQALWPYVSLWIYVGVAPALMPTLAAAARYGAWAAALCGTGLACFWAWPTTLPPGWAPSTSGTQTGLELIRGLDAPGNACPSLHVATAVFTALWIGHQLRAFGAPAWPRLVNLGWVATIVWSTVALRQHVVIDVVAGVALGLAFGWPSLRWGPSPVDGDRARTAGDRRL